MATKRTQGSLISLMIGDREIPIDNSRITFECEFHESISEPEVEAQWVARAIPSWDIIAKADIDPEMARKAFQLVSDRIAQESDRHFNELMRRVWSRDGGDISDIISALCTAFDRRRNLTGLTEEELQPAEEEQHSIELPGHLIQLPATVASEIDA